MMKNVFSRLCFMMAVILSLYSCRNDYFPDPHTAANPNASRFRIINLKDIPHVEKFIHQKSGRTDMKVPLGAASVSGKADLTIGNIQTSAIVEVNYGDKVYYVFKIDNLVSGDTVYNLEVKQMDGVPVKAEIIEYDPEDGAALDFSAFYRECEFLRVGRESRIYGRLQ